jgi:hypothetical protein
MLSTPASNLAVCPKVCHLGRSRLPLPKLCATQNNSQHSFVIWLLLRELL